MTILGYAVILSYVFALIFLLGPMVLKAAGGETSRKIIHTMLFMVWVFIDLFFKNTLHQIIIPLIFFVLNTLSYKFKIYKSVEREEGNHLGTIYFAIAITVVMSLALIFPQLYLPSGAAAFCLTFGDGFAALIGYNFPSRKLRGGKSILGFVSCFTASGLCLFAFRQLYWPELSLAAIGILAGAAAISELVGNGLDNFTVTFTVFALSFLLVNRGDPALLWSTGLAVAIFLVVYLSRAITYEGGLLSMVMVFCFAYFGGCPGIGFLLLTYFSIFFIGLLRKRLLPKADGTKAHGRGFFQILINGGLGTVLITVYGLTGQRWALTAALVSIGGNFIDSVSSDLGTLSKKPPYDPLRRVFVERGLSGGVSLLGTGAAFCCSLLIGLYLILALDLAVLHGVLAVVLVFGQSCLDTVLGSCFQVKYRCPVCGRITERKTHCAAAVHHRGLSWMGNNAVNLISSFVVTTLASILFRIPLS